MKYNRIIACVSFAILIASLAVYIPCEIKSCNVGVDISIGFFASTLMSFCFAIIGYFTEKQHIENEVLKQSSDFTQAKENFALLVKKQIDVVDLIEECKLMRYETFRLYSALLIYYKGKCVKDKDLKKVLTTFYSYSKALVSLEFYLSHESIKLDVVARKTVELIEQGERVLVCYVEWLKGSGIKLGKEYDFEENFINNYEKENNNG